MTRAASLIRKLDGIDPFLLVARVTLLATLVVVHNDRAILLIVAVATAVLFLQERLLRSPWPWFVLAAVLGWDQLAEWWLVDDHAVATTYWLAAIGLSRFGRRPDIVLAVSGRFLVGALFAFAFGWKLLSSQYVSGDFFEYTLLRDPRFEPVAVLAGGADEAQLTADRLEVSTFTARAGIDETVTVGEGPRTSLVSHAFTYFGLAVEGAVAFAFLLPFRGPWHLARPVTLITFCLTTYAVVPIAGFGLLLLTMGMAHATEPWLRRAYLGTAVVVFTWNSILAGFIV